MASFFVGEGNARVWKGEPFEQAMAYCLIAAFDGLQGDWGNVRASASNSIFLLRDFSDAITRGRRAAVEGDKPLDVDPSVADREAILVDLANRDEEDKETKADLEYRLVPSDFELGYALRAIAADQVNDYDDREEALAGLLAVAPRLESLAFAIRRGDYNTVLMVDYGLGPEKYGAGMDRVIEAYRPRFGSGDQFLLVTVDSSWPISFPVITDVNRLALDTKWSNLEGMRRAKSILGTALVIGGAAVLATADSVEEMLIGGGIMLVGALFKASAGADTRHCEVLPQRTYLALLNLPPGRRAGLELEIEGIAGTRLVLPAVEGPRSAGDPAVFHYVRLSNGQDAWRTSGQINYANDATGALRSSELPYVLGGRCVRTPVPELMAEYYEAGLPPDVTLNDLLLAYEEEGLVIAGVTLNAVLGRHVLEGGNALYTPMPCSTGFCRLYAREHRPYVPRSATLRDLATRIAADAVPDTIASSSGS